MAGLVHFEGRCHPICPGLSKRRAPPPDRGGQKFKIFKNCSVFDGTFVDRRGFAPRVKRRVTTIFFLAYLVKKKPGRPFRRCQRTISQGFRLSKHRTPLRRVHPPWTSFFVTAFRTVSFSCAFKLHFICIHGRNLVVIFFILKNRTLAQFGCACT